MYIWENKEWPHFVWDEHQISELLLKVRHQQGRLLGMAETLGFDVKSPVMLDAMTADIITSSEIEGIALNADEVRSSVAWQLGIENVGIPASNRYIEGVVDVMFDAVHHYSKPLTKERLFGWHRALFPAVNRLAHITVGSWRQGDMQVVSGRYGSEKVHFEAPPANDVTKMMKELLQWINKEGNGDAVLKAAIAHLWLSAFTRSATAMDVWHVLSPTCCLPVRTTPRTDSTACRLKWLCNGAPTTMYWKEHRRGSLTLANGCCGFLKG